MSEVIQFVEAEALNLGSFGCEDKLVFGLGSVVVDVGVANAEALPGCCSNAQPAARTGVSLDDRGAAREEAVRRSSILVSANGRIAPSTTCCLKSVICEDDRRGLIKSPSQGNRRRGVFGFW